MNNTTVIEAEKGTQGQLQAKEQELARHYERLCKQGLKLDLTRGKPSEAQLQLAAGLDGILASDCRAPDGTDCRNYGTSQGLTCTRKLGADLLQVPHEEVIAAGNSSLTLMYQAVLTGYLYGFGGDAQPWRSLEHPKFICPSPGYDRHFTICEQLGIDMVSVPMTDIGPDMDAVETLLREDPEIVGIWCVPKYSNPTGVTYHQDTLERLAQASTHASPGFRIFWDNAYAIHDWFEHTYLGDMRSTCLEYGVDDKLIQFGSTSKITFAGGGVAFVSSTEQNLEALARVMNAMSIGPDKVNQLRHSRLFAEFTGLREHMAGHAEILRPKFECVYRHLREHFDGDGPEQWHETNGGYFVSFNTRPGCAKYVVELAARAGIKLTPAGATFPYGEDPQDSNIRIAPTYPPLDQLDTAMATFVLCVELAAVRQQLGMI
ncbi:aminotransferase class I/II-fold pyridoxal phosphate-dependent enzyme [Biformimicrobium ophioploci]|uniref:Aminotransferase class I/II-fold pyridoxal phosphate-dependent enzyme n=1 Tax=Biformimicrobium ophioploci TaxID=3036711 RepID=A0ABQ6LWM1_9GAMM|nr:aminotransferase class I/II-fold pyridoxal phosphate-dependent enzyme [Microbulbifer sp. NKW57]GMG86514.1 aminotransferase class I/II-fold pyridoxal phosphate-dependent enzyme [Microbulbifer sp. NKW57]